MFYVNTKTKDFCKADNPAVPWHIPDFRFGETAEFDVAFVNPDGSPYQLPAEASYFLAVDDNVDHRDELAILTDNITVADNVLHVTAICRSEKLLHLTRYGEYLAEYIEIQMSVSGSTERTVIAYSDRGVRLIPRVFTTEGVSPEAEPLDYITITEFNREISGVAQKANSAVSAANEANELATSASGTAEEAKETADGIAGVANQAQQTAAEAKTLASNAKGTADNLSSAVSSASAKADNAQSAAATAQTTANSAAEAATLAQQSASSAATQAGNAKNIIESHQLNPDAHSELFNNKAEKEHDHTINQIEGLSEVLDGMSDIPQRAEEAKESAIQANETAQNAAESAAEAMTTAEEAKETAIQAASQSKEASDGLNGKSDKGHTHTAAQVGAEASGTVNAHNLDAYAHQNGFASITVSGEANLGGVNTGYVISTGPLVAPGVDLKNGEVQYLNFYTGENVTSFIQQMSSGVLTVNKAKFPNQATFMYVPYGGKSIIFRNDGSSFYIMNSSSGSDTWDTLDQYPLRVNLTDGICYINGSAALNLAAPKFSSYVDYGAVSQLTVSEAGWLYAEVTSHDEYKKVLIYNQIVLSVGGTGDQRGSVFLPVKAGDAVKCTTSDGTLTAVDNMRIYRPMY